MLKFINIYFPLEQCLEIDEDCMGCRDCCCEGTQCRYIGDWDYECRNSSTPGIILTKYCFYPKKGTYITVNTKNNRLMIRSIVVKKRNCVNAFSTIWMTFQHMFKVIIIYFLLVQCLEIGTGCSICSTCCCEGTECIEVGPYEYECKMPTTPGIILNNYYLYPKK